LDPEPDPGFVPCLGAPLNSIATIRLHSTMGLFNVPNAGVPDAIGYNMATVTRSPGLWQFTTRITAGFLCDMTTGIRCVNDGYGSTEWQTMLSGRAISPTGYVLSGNLPWHHNSNVTASFDGYARQLDWFETNIVAWVSPTWRMLSALSRLREAPDEARSRPPNPPIPVIG
jgi:hypothetical protein